MRTYGFAHLLPSSCLLRRFFPAASWVDARQYLLASESKIRAFTYVGANQRGGQENICIFKCLYRVVFLPPSGCRRARRQEIKSILAILLF
jgi:hypothetical protein